jgi:phosphoglycolate phosphatase
MQIIIFDMDGTLIDTAEDITITVNHIRKVNHGLPPLSSERVVEIINMQHRNLPLLFYGTQTYLPEDRALFERHYYAQCIQNPRLYPGIASTLEKLHKRGAHLSVATNAPSIFAKRMLSHLQIVHRFDLVLGPDIAGASKPEPDMLLQILRHYDFEPGEHSAWMVGDNPKDMLAAKRAGIGTLFSTWGFACSERPVCDLTIDTPQMLLDITVESDLFVRRHRSDDRV